MPQSLVAGVPDVRDVAHDDPDAVTYLLVFDKKPQCTCVVSYNPANDVMRLGAITPMSKKRVREEKDSIGLKWRRKHPEVVTQNMKYDADGHLMRDDNPPKSMFEQRCLDFVDGLPLEIKEDVLLALK